MNKDWRPDDARREILRLCHAGLDPLAFRHRVAAQLQRGIPFDAWCWPTADPATLLVTGATGENIPGGKTQRFFEIEYIEPDFNKFGDLARQRLSVGVLSSASGGELHRSPRYREIFGPAGIGDDLRAALTVDSSTWGYLALHRDEKIPFTDYEAAWLGQLAPHLAEGMRTSLLITSVEEIDADAGPAIVILDEQMKIASANHSARRWIGEIVGKHAAPDDGLPDPLAAVAATLVALEREERDASVPRARVQTRSGQWLVVHATRLSPLRHGEATGRIAVVMEPARPHELMPLILAAYALTPRESQITQLVLVGKATNLIAVELAISPLTVQQHLKGVFEKIGVHSKRELAGRIFAQHFWPRLATNAPLAADGSYRQ